MSRNPFLNQLSNELVEARITRNPFSNQPSRSVIIETNYLTDDQLLLIEKTLCNILSLLKCLNGSERLTQLNIVAINSNYLTQLFETNNFKSEKFNRVYFILNKLNKLKSPEKGPINLAVIQQALIKSLENKFHADISYISSRSCESINNDISQALIGIDHGQLKSLTILCLNSFLMFKTFNQINNNNNQSVDSASQRQMVDHYSLITYNIGNSELELECYFKRWFHDADRSSEHVHIELVHSTVIKCDLTETILDLSRFDSDLNPSLSVDVGQNVIKPKSIIVPVYNSLPIYYLKVIGLVSQNGFCESAVFGNSYLLSATKNWTMNLDEINLNTQRFKALVQLLFEKGAILIALLKNDKNINVYYAILSSKDSKSLLIKQIVNKELALPYQNDIDIVNNIEPTHEVVNEIHQQLGQFLLNDFFNPLAARSNLYENVIELLMLSDNGDKLHI